MQKRNQATSVQEISALTSLVHLSAGRSFCVNNWCLFVQWVQRRGRGEPHCSGSLGDTAAGVGLPNGRGPGASQPPPGGQRAAPFMDSTARRAAVTGAPSPELTSDRSRLSSRVVCGPAPPPHGSALARGYPGLFNCTSSVEKQGGSTS